MGGAATTAEAPTAPGAAARRRANLCRCYPARAARGEIDDGPYVRNFGGALLVVCRCVAYLSEPGQGGGKDIHYPVCV